MLLSQVFTTEAVGIPDTGHRYTVEQFAGESRY